MNKDLVLMDMKEQVGTEVVFNGIYEGLLKKKLPSIVALPVSGFVHTNMFCECKVRVQDWERTRSIQSFMYCV